MDDPSNATPAPSAGERCELTDLLTDQCGRRRHRGGTAPRAFDVARVGRAFRALYASVCPSCDGRIHQDDLIQRTDEGAYVHEVCP